jgi:hypothetical protein
MTQKSKISELVEWWCLKNTYVQSMYSADDVIMYARQLLSEEQSQHKPCEIDPSFNCNHLTAVEEQSNPREDCVQKGIEEMTTGESTPVDTRGLVGELKVFAEQYGGIPKREILNILSRYESTPTESLAVLADRKGYCCADCHAPGKELKEWFIELWKFPDNGSVYSKTFFGSTHSAAELAARQYLEGLKDVEKGGANG